MPYILFYTTYTIILHQSISFIHTIQINLPLKNAKYFLSVITPGGDFIFFRKYSFSKQLNHVVKT